MSEAEIERKQLRDSINNIVDYSSFNESELIKLLDKMSPLYKEMGTVDYKIYFVQHFISTVTADIDFELSKTEIELKIKSNIVEIIESDSNLLLSTKRGLSRYFELNPIVEETTSYDIRSKIELHLRTVDNSTLSEHLFTIKVSKEFELIADSR